MTISICIPTYNRVGKVLDTLSFIIKEVKELPNTDYELIVGDNCSTDDTFPQVDKLLKKDGIGRVIKNQENLGLVGNIINLASMAKGDYVWFMGDDDVYYPGIVGRILLEVKEQHPGYLFLNHRTYKEGQKDTPVFASAVDLDKPSRYEEGYKAIVDIWNLTGTSLMFISCLVFKRDYLNEAILKNKHFNLASPLYYSFFVGAKERVVIVKDIFVDDILGNISWKASHNDVYLRQIPRYLINLPSYGYPKKMARMLLLKYLWARKIWFTKDFIFRLLKKEY